MLLTKSSVCVILLFTGCTFGTEEKNAGISDGADLGETIETAEETTEESIDVQGEFTEEPIAENPYYEQNDAYKLFYGKWEITGIVSESRYLGGDEVCEDILGMQVTYLPDQYEFGGSVTVKDPNYLISIFPTDSRLLFDQRQVSMDTLLPESDYFVWVQIADIPIEGETGMGYDFGTYVDNGFFIKDDNTRYLFVNHCIYEMNRVSYMDGYDHDRALSYWENW